ncbi:cyclin-D3-2-like [Zingiber officinale]|uniref:cyclin-D3-2-like n=1 Tax=Zingiber officinale TaxID=94328 RepID=UPI001C4DAF16|nr:cyclin-D3-2-like [Zingiber officinale]
MALLSLFDHLYCREENLEEFGEEEFEQSVPATLLSTPRESERHLLSATEVEPEEEWAELLCSLLSKEGEFLPKLFPDGADFSYLQSARKVAVEWVARAARRHGFAALTALLAVNYLDRCFLPCDARGELLRLQDDKPWMGRLAAVACLSLAAKVEETRVPLSVDLQMPETPEDGGFVFEPKTVRRMELLVLSALRWRMNPVTPLSFLHHFIPRLHSKAKSAGTDAGAVRRIRALLRRCEATLLSAMADGRWVRYPTSAWAAAALLQATESSEGSATAAEVQETRRLISLLKAPKEKVEECHQVISETSRTGMIGHKRKLSPSDLHFCRSPPSPSGVIGSCFSRESSYDSWAPPPPRKRSNCNVSDTPADNRDGEKLRFTN